MGRGRRDKVYLTDHYEAVFSDQGCDGLPLLSIYKGAFPETFATAT
jgi:hypothetical protein